jgi:protein-arginine kinase activator protein McsA
MASEFASLTEESMEAFAETEEYELAAIVRNNLKLQNH